MWYINSVPKEWTKSQEQSWAFPEIHRCFLGKGNCEKLFQGKPLHGIKKKCRPFAFLGKLRLTGRQLIWDGDVWIFFFQVSVDHLGMGRWPWQDFLVLWFLWDRALRASQIALIQNLHSGIKSSSLTSGVGMGWKLWEMNSCWAHVLVSMATVIEVWAKVIGLSESPQRLKTTCLVPSQERFFYLPQPGFW